MAVFEECNITAAASRLFITQPTLSTTIETLEDELGVTLFVRQARGVEGTEAAHRLYSRAKWLIADTDSLAREFRETSPCLEVTVGIEADLGDGVVGALVQGGSPTRRSAGAATCSLAGRQGGAHPGSVGG